MYAESAENGENCDDFRGIVEAACKTYDTGTEEMGMIDNRLDPYPEITAFIPFNTIFGRINGYFREHGSILSI